MTSTAKRWIFCFVPIGVSPRWPRKITLDGLKQSHLALWLLRREDPKWKYVQVRSSQYLNNLIEQDHPAIASKSFMMSNKWYGSLGLASNVKCS